MTLRRGWPVSAATTRPRIRAVPLLCCWSSRGGPAGLWPEGERAPWPVSVCVCSWGASASGIAVTVNKGVRDMRHLAIHPKRSPRGQGSLRAAGAHPALAPESAQHLGRDQPAECAGAGRRQRIDVDAADRTLLELNRLARADQLRRELPDSRFVPDEREACPPRVLLQLGHDSLVAATGHQ